MFGLGIWELLLLLAVIVLIFGANRLPRLGRALGESVKEVRSVSREISPTSEKSKETSESDQEKSNSLAEDLLPELKKINSLRTKAGRLQRLGRWIGLR
jgi:sec-independent protein translocase protein TatA